jgi:hypothetical protein
MATSRKVPILPGRPAATSRPRRAGGRPPPSSPAPRRRRRRHPARRLQCCASMPNVAGSLPQPAAARPVEAVPEWGARRRKMRTLAIATGQSGAGAGSQGSRHLGAPLRARGSCAGRGEAGGSPLDRAARRRGASGWRRGRAASHVVEVTSAPSPSTRASAYSPSPPPSSQSSPLVRTRVIPPRPGSLLPRSSSWGAALGVARPAGEQGDVTPLRAAKGGLARWRADAPARAVDLARQRGARLVGPRKNSTCWRQEAAPVIAREVKVRREHSRDRCAEARRPRPARRARGTTTRGCQRRRGRAPRR